MWTARASAFGALRTIGVSRWLKARIRTHGAVAVLNLHSVSPASNPFWPPIHPSHFATWLRRALRFVEFRTFGTLAEPSTKPIAVLSFDDGYADFYEHAMPVLDRYGITANLNIITGAIESGEPPWNVRLYDWLAASTLDQIRTVRIDGFPDKLVDDSTTSKVRFGTALSRYLKLRPAREREALLEPLKERLANAPRGRRMLTASQVEEIARRHEIGSHSHSHDSMGFQADTDFREDFFRSKAWLAARKIPCEIYAFPNGSYQQEQIVWLQEQGVRTVLLVDECFARPEERRVFPRLTVSGGSVAELEMAALGMPSLRQVARVN